MVAFAFAAAAGSAAAQAGPPGSRTVASGLVRGGVYDAETGVGLEGATVAVTGPAFTRTVSTDERGDYSIAVPDGRPLRIRVERIGYRSLDLDVREIPDGTRLDFRLTRDPVSLARLDVVGDAASRALEAIGPPATAETAPNPRPSLERQRAPPLWGPVLIPSRHDAPGPAPPPPPAPGRGIGVRGGVARQGATYWHGAPRQLGASASPLADPFSAESTGGARLWDAGAPARITGGLEYVLELADPAPPADAGFSAAAALDLIRSNGAATWRAERFAVRAAIGTTTPWVDRVATEPGHRSRHFEAHAWAAAGSRHRVDVSFAGRDEAFPIAGATDAPSVRAEELAASVAWQMGLGGGALHARAGAARFRGAIPITGPTPAIVRLGREQSHVSVELRNALHDELAVAVGADHIAQVWRTATTIANVAAPGAGANRYAQTLPSFASIGGDVATVAGKADLVAQAAGVFAEIAWAPTAMFALSAGARYESTDAAPATISPRARMVWRPSDRLRLELGSGVHRQLLPAAGGGPTRAAEAIFASGVHHAVRLTMDAGPVQLGLDGYAKRLRGIPRLDGGVVVRGVGVGVSLPTPRTGIFDLLASLERRSSRAGAGWTRAFRVDWKQELPAGLHLRSRLVSSHAVGALLLAAGVADTLGNATVDATDAAVPSPASIGLDIELARRLGFAPIELYAQLFNALGREERPIYVPASGAKLPRVLTIGARMRWRDRQ